MKKQAQNIALQSVQGQEETPRMKCLLAVQAAHSLCLASAKTPAEKTACDKALTKALAACPAP